MKTFDIFEVLLKYPIFRRESQKINMEVGLTKNGDWTVGDRGGGGWQERGGLLSRRGVDTSMQTLSSQNNLKVMTNYYEKKCLLVITKNKRHSWKQFVSITYTMEKKVFAAATFHGLWVVSFQTK